MPKIRVLIVDDAAVFRRLVMVELSNDPALEVVGTAANGRIALAKMPQVCPDIVILDVEMPEMDGLSALKELRKTYPRLPIIMFSALTERGAEATLEALFLGATDYFTKPVNEGGLDASLKVVREQLIPEIKALCASALTGGPGLGVRDQWAEVRRQESGGRRQEAGAGSQAAGLGPFTPDPRFLSSDSCRLTPSSGTLTHPAATQTPRHPGTSPGKIQILAIGTSTGGPNALAEVFRRLPADFPVPIVIVQHMPPMFTRLLAERMSAQFPVRVQEGSSGTHLQPGQAWIAPGDHHMIVVRDGAKVRLMLHQDPPENSCRPSADVLLRSVAKTFGSSSLAVILTGMGQDGLRGCEAVSEAGGQILAQDEATSVVWGMPGYVTRAGLADRVLPLPLIADEIVRRVKE
jgi:two-component system chemotaxis response regulator CheB